MSVDERNVMREPEAKHKKDEIELPVLKNKAIKEKLLTRSHKIDCLPIMLKVYNDGKLTSALKNAHFVNTAVKFSCPRGRGLELEDTKAGRVIVVAGGTGLFPFSDIIDLLFKAQVIE
jgi:NAD(P)H-flavin reductase